MNFPSAQSKHTFLLPLSFQNLQTSVENCNYPKKKKKSANTSVDLVSKQPEHSWGLVCPLTNSFFPLSPSKPATQQSPQCPCPGVKHPVVPLTSSPPPSLKHTFFFNPESRFSTMTNFYSLQNLRVKTVR